ncbi:hypothetical protein [Pseudomonas aeruginosa]|nr:hypothetical protein [Pseudomonas aeruginosa]ELC7284475.1 hypothetical protein [Pseudomonas aeruginosa]ELM3821246.1 hypothetical protein [Pseudomonas aeruginosa]ELN9531754.1 hypothetical protein [Pseudomonas aeruginosa]MBH8743479.1 hypothetical protein [Pseudomonas aeruginosa]MBX6103574.1 hypothetical protein [Pseudomonas aeruginosa]
MCVSSCSCCGVDRSEPPGSGHGTETIQSILKKQVDFLLMVNSYPVSEARRENNKKDANREFPAPVQPPGNPGQTLEKPHHVERPRHVDAYRQPGQ